MGTMKQTKKASKPQRGPALTVSLDRALLTAARDSARAEDISTAALVRRAIREYLKARDAKEAA